MGAVPVHTPVVPATRCPTFTVPVTAGCVVAASTGGAATASLATLSAACVFPETVAVTRAAMACPTSAATGTYVAAAALSSVTPAQMALTLVKDDDVQASLARLPQRRQEAEDARRLAKQKGIEISVAKFPWAASGRALTLDRADGLTKLVMDPETERVLGVGIVGQGAGELIAEGVVAVEMGATARDLALCAHPHPTLSETLMEAAEIFYGHATHTFVRKQPQKQAAT